MLQNKSTMKYQKIDPKVDPRLATALNIIINCKALRPFVDTLLMKVIILSSYFGALFVILINDTDF